MDDFNHFQIVKTFHCLELLRNSQGNLISRNVPFPAIMDIAQAVLNSIPLEMHNKNRVFGVAANKSVLLVGVVIGILKSGNAFAIFQPAPIDYLRERFKHFQISTAFFEPTMEVDGQNEDIGPCMVGHFGNDFVERRFEFDSCKICYAIQTTGTTGQPKIVHVPFDAIIPNIVDFIDHFSVHNSSTLIFSTSTNFDPSMVELLAAIRAGAELVIPPRDWDGTRIGEVLPFCQQRVPFLQLTPAVLKCLPNTSLNQLFGPNPLVDCLLIGGEDFPLNFIKRHFNESTRVRVFNVYGVTEVSCWASCHELKVDKIGRYKNGLIPIGQPLLSTRLEISKEGILQIHGRTCFINGKRSTVGATCTGDIAFTLEENEGEIYVKSRYKPNSQLPSLELENLMLNVFPKIITSKLIFMHNCRFLFVDHFDGQSTIQLETIRAKIPSNLWPTRVFWNALGGGKYMNENGKLDDGKLQQFVLAQYDSMSLIELLQENYGIYPEKDTLEASMRSLGIGSLEAAELAFSLSAATKNGENFEAAEIMQFILDEQHTLGQFIAKFGQTKIYPKIAPTKCKQLRLAIAKPGAFHVENLWDIPLGKCVDGTPVHSNGVIYAASHSGTLKGMKISDGSIPFEFTAEGDRFEAGCAVNGEFIAIGGFAGNMFIFDNQNSQPKFTVKCAGEIRMAPVFGDDEQQQCLFWADYPGNVWRFEFTTGRTKLLCSLNLGACRSSPLLHGQMLLFGTLNGHVVSVDKENGNIYWKLQLDSPIFASPILFQQNCAIVLTVKGSLNLVEISDGKIIDSLALSNFTSPTSFFDPPTIFDQNFLLIPAGMEHLFLVKNFVLLTQISMPGIAPIVRRPLLLGKHIFVLNTKGQLFHFSKEILLDDSTQLPITNSVLHLDGAETFGHPLILEEFADGNSAQNSFIIAIGTRHLDGLHCFRTPNT